MNFIEDGINVYVNIVCNRYKWISFHYRNTCTFKFIECLTCRKIFQNSNKVKSTIGNV